ncbi:MAG: 3-dehydroquinate synthase [Ruminococcaceae bacterium]|nr:3-dehydroquinate synthase [Oscillospiraceae bacterium]
MILHVDLKENGYDIVIERGALKKAGELISLDRKVLIVTDKNVPRGYSDSVASFCKAPVISVIEGGEMSKNLDTFKELCETMLENGFSRKDCVVAVGGGVVGDLAGFAAAAYMRGIDFYNIPTTLLSQVDSSIGGKTAVNLGSVKNIVGAFYQPKKVIIDPDTLKTLPERQISNGAAEAVKMGLTSDKELFDIFKSDDYKDHIEEIIIRSLKVKKYVVETDEKETGLRKILNFGHTIGHAIESGALDGSLYHGECVALGMIPMCSKKVRGELIPVLKRLSLPYEFNADVEKLFSSMEHDKKLSGKTITVIRVEEAGSFVMEDILFSDLKEQIRGTVR